MLPRPRLVPDPERTAADADAAAFGVPVPAPVPASPERAVRPYVFGVARGIPQTYVRRCRVDDRFVEALERERHVVVRGQSKQGKTLAWRGALAGRHPLVVACDPGTTREGVAAAILRRAGASVTLAEGDSPSGARALSVAVPPSGPRPVDVERRRSRWPSPLVPSEQAPRFEVDPRSATEVAGILDLLGGEGTRRVVVLEDFHRLDEAVRKAVVADLKVYHDCSRLLLVLVLTTERSGKADPLAGAPELKERTDTIDADLWGKPELEAILAKGERALNIRFPPQVKDALLDAARGNVGQLQELCQTLCDLAGVEGRQPRTRTIGTVEGVRELFFRGIDPHGERASVVGPW